MKVTISVGGIWDAFALAEQLEKRNSLKKIITSYPRFRLKGKMVDRKRVVSIWEAEAIYRILRATPWRNLAGHSKAFLFDALARRHLDQCEVFVSYAGFGLHSIRRAKANGATTVLFRNSPHIEFQRAIREEEFARYGVSLPPVDEGSIQRELQEYEEAHYIRVPSDFARRTFLERGFDPDKVVMIPHGVDLENFPPVTKSDTVFRVLFVGGIGLWKGLQYLLEAVRQLRLRNSEVVLIGGISDDAKPILRQYGGLFKYQGVISRRELYRYYSQASVYVLPSLEEGMALTVLEAMACGVPVIVSEHTGVESVVRDGQEGFIIPIRDVTAIKEKLLHLYENQEIRARMGQAAFERVKSFTWDWYGDRVVQTFQALLDRSRALRSRKSNSPARHYVSYWKRPQDWRWDDGLCERCFGGVFEETDVVLDVGCGRGENYQDRLIGKVKELHGLDLSPVAVERAKTVGVRAQMHDLEDPFPFPDRSFDGAVCMEVLEHLFDPKFCLGEIWRVLQPGGRLVVGVPNVGYFRERLVMLSRAELPISITDHSDPWRGDHIRFFNVRSLTNLLRACGFELIKVQSNGECSIFDGLAAMGKAPAHLSNLIRSKLPSSLRLAFLGDHWPSLFAPHLVIVARKSDT